MKFCALLYSLRSLVIHQQAKLPFRLSALFRQRSIFPGSLPPSIVDAKELNFRVRYGYGWNLLAITTGFRGFTLKTKQCKNYSPENSSLKNLTLVKPSTYQYQSATCVTALPPLTYQPFSLYGVLPDYSVGNLILRGASRLDAFSVYPVRTQLPSHAVGTTTGAPVVRPSRSSRTKDSSFQISCAHDRQGPNCLTTF